MGIFVKELNDLVVPMYDPGVKFSDERLELLNMIPERCRVPCTNNDLDDSNEMKLGPKALDFSLNFPSIACFTFDLVIVRDVVSTIGFVSLK